MAHEIDYSKEAGEDAKEFIENFIEEIIDQLISDGSASTDLNNDYDNGDAFIHETYTDRDYNLQEAAKLLHDLTDYEETDSGLWEGQEPRQAVATQAAFTYSSAVTSVIIDIIKSINDDEEIGDILKEYEDVTEPDDPKVGQLRKKLEKRIDQILKEEEHYA
jgi:hypothetical protein